MIYLDNAASSHPKPDAVYRASDLALRIGANPGRSGHIGALQAARIIHDAREEIAKLLNAPDSARVIFTQNATHAINLALKGFLKAGDHVVTSTMEHNSVTRPLHALSQDGVAVTAVSGGAGGVIDPQKIEDAIGPRTRLVALTHASNVTGALLDLDAMGEICGRRGVELFLDASQTAGAVPINVAASKVSMLAAPGHKGLLGPQGTGFLYVAPGISLTPLMEGGTGFLSESREMPEELPERLEAGTMNTPGIAGLLAGVEHILTRTVENIREHELAITRHILENYRKVDGLLEYGPADPEKRVAVFSFNLGERDGAHVGYVLDEIYKIAVRVGLHCAPDAHKTLGTFPRGSVRASFGPFSTIDDAKTLLAAFGEIAKIK